MIWWYTKEEEDTLSWQYLWYDDIRKKKKTHWVDNTYDMMIYERRRRHTELTILMIWWYTKEEEDTLSWQYLWYDDIRKKKKTHWVDNTYDMMIYERRRRHTELTILMIWWYTKEEKDTLSWQYLWYDDIRKKNKNKKKGRIHRDSFSHFLHLPRRNPYLVYVSVTACLISCTHPDETHTYYTCPGQRFSFHAPIPTKPMHSIHVRDSVSHFLHPPRRNPYLVYVSGTAFLISCTHPDETHA